jgi:hypothetical protein
MCRPLIKPAIFLFLLQNTHARLITSSHFLMDLLVTMKHVTGIIISNLTVVFLISIQSNTCETEPVCEHSRDKL